MGEIVAAMGTVHAPQLFVRPPSEDPAQLDTDIAAMRILGKDLDEAKPDVAIVIGNDHMETFFLTSVPTFAILAGERSHAEFASKTYDLPIHQGFAEDLLDKLVKGRFDMAYSQDAVKSQIWIAVSAYVLVAIVKKRLNLSASLYEILQILSLTMFEKIPLDQLLAQTAAGENYLTPDNQLLLFD